jgi:hypothetical protein
LRSNLIVTASLLLLFALPGVAPAAAFSVKIERIGGQPEAKGEVVRWSVSVSANNRATQRVTLTVSNAADITKGRGAIAPRTWTLTVGPGAVQRMDVETWGDRPRLRTTAGAAKQLPAQTPQLQGPAAGPAPDKAAPEKPATPPKAAAPAKSAAPTKPAADAPAKPAPPAGSPPPADAPTPGQKPSRR